MPYWGSGVGGCWLIGRIYGLGVGDEVWGGRGRLLDGERDVSEWWRVMATLWGEDWFNAHVSRSVGDGRHTYFWSDVWIGGVALRDMFRRLFELSVNQRSTVSDMHHLGWDGEGEAWRGGDCLLGRRSRWGNLFLSFSL